MRQALFIIASTISATFSCPILVFSQNIAESLNLLDSISTTILTEAESQGLLVDPLFDDFVYLQTVCNLKPDMFEMVESNSDAIVDYITSRKGTHAGILLDFQSVEGYLSALDLLVRKSVIDSDSTQLMNLLASYLYPHDNYKIMLRNDKKRRNYIDGATTLIENWYESGFLRQQSKLFVLKELYTRFNPEIKEDPFFSDYKSIGDTITTAIINDNETCEYRVWHNTRQSPVQISSSISLKQSLMSISVDSCSENGFAFIPNDGGRKLNIDFFYHVDEHQIISIIINCLCFEKIRTNPSTDTITLKLKGTRLIRLIEPLCDSLKSLQISIIDVTQDDERKECKVVCKIKRNMAKRLVDTEKVFYYENYFERDTIK